MKNKLLTVWVSAFVAAFAISPSTLFAGPFINGAYIKGANLAWLDGAYDHDIGTNQIDNYTCAYNSAHMNTYLADLHNMGITVVRLWLNENKQGLVLNVNGDVIGLQPTFLTNLDSIIQLAGQNGIAMYLTLNEGDSDWVLNTTKQSSYINNAVIPMATRYKGNTHIFAYDVMNEIDGVTVPFGSATWAQSQAYVSATVSAIHSADPGRLATCSVGYYPAWSDLAYLTGLGLDFYDFHDYEDSPSFPSAANLNLDKPIFIGECGQSAQDTTYTDAVQNNNMSNFLNSAYSGGYAGVGIWAYQYPGCPYDVLPMVNPDASWRPVCYTIQNWTAPGSVPTNLPIYTNSGSLLSGFQNYSWATNVNLENTSPVYSGSYSISVTAAAYTALSLFYPELNTAPYASLNFWINGGAAGAQGVQVMGVTNVGNNQYDATIYTLPALAPNTWTQFKIPLSMLGVANITNCQGFWFWPTLSGATTFYLDSIQLDTSNSPPTISSIPASGTVGTAIAITGENFTGATAVTFNGVAAGFTVISWTEIAAIVPSTAASGTVAVTTPYGTGLSGSPFTVLGLPANLPPFTTVNNFNSAGGAGTNPVAGLILAGGTLYGTAVDGGTNGFGAVFAVNTNGTDAVGLHGFNGVSDGMGPQSALVLAGNTLYGTSQDDTGANVDGGQLFAVNTDGTGYTNRLTFDSSYPGVASPNGLFLAGNTFYGTARYGGSNEVGAVFAVNTNGSNFTNLHSFTFSSDGANPIGGVILSGATLYGTASEAGVFEGTGTIFSVNTNGSNFMILHSFTPYEENGTDGAVPMAALILSGSTLYGTAESGGSTHNGTIFSLNTNGSNFTTLYNFSAFQTNLLGVDTNSDGALPMAGLVLSGNTLYGVASAGGNSGNGTVFALNTNGSGFTTLHHFTALNDGTNSDGATPEGTLLLAGNTLYGTASGGGSGGGGTVFSLSLSPLNPTINLVRLGTNIVLTWPATYNGFILTSATNLNQAVWNTVSPGPVVVNGLNTVTNPVSGTSKFFRLANP